MRKRANITRFSWLNKACSCLVMIVLILVIPAPAYAAGGTISASGTYDVGDYGNDSVITIDPGLTVTLTNTGGATYTNLQIACGAGVKLTVDGIKIDDTSNGNACPLSFTGIGNSLALAGMSDLRAGANQPGVKTESTTSLEISGGGTLKALGGSKAAGIGGGNAGSGGIITIKGGAVNAQGGDYGAGIGSGDQGGSGMITIEGGTVNATGGVAAAGIGSSRQVHCTDTILISGGQVTAKGGAYAAGIGCGFQGFGETIILSGGVIYAQGGVSAAYDIGNNDSGIESLTISGDAAVFLSTDCITPFTAHTHKTIMSVPDNKVYGVSISGWAPPFGAYLFPCTLTYDANGGTGAVPAALTQHKNTATALLGGEGLNRGGGAFICWNTAADGSGTDYAEGELFTFAADTTLYAKYPVMVNEIKVTSGGNTVNRTQTLQMSADVLPANAADKSFTWSVQNGTGSASIDASGLLTGITAGTVTVKATAKDGSLVSGAKEITVTPRPVTISAGGTYKVGDYGNDSVITISPGLTVTLTDTSGATYTNVQIACGAGVNLTVDGVKIDDTLYSNACPLSFTGIGNSLALEGASDLRAGANQPGVKAESTTFLEISGSGALEARGGSLAAGIGGGNAGSGGIITVKGGTVTAQGGDDGAGIGGGDQGGSGMITIEGGMVNATGGTAAAGIGSSRQVHCTETILISGGRVTAKGGAYAAGIGCGFQGFGESIILSGGVIYAQGGVSAAYDIGNNNSGIESLTIAGGAAVFLSADSCITPSTSHTHKTITSVPDNKVYGVSIDGWTPPIGAYITPVTLSYSANGGTGTVPGSVIQHINTSGSVGGGGGLSRLHYLFAGWNTAADGSGTGYAPGDSIPFAADTTLYAQWAPNEYTVSFEPNGGSAVGSISADGGTRITAPAAPTKPGFTFAGWYKEPGCIHSWDFGADTVPGNITLYAKWMIPVIRCTVSFNSQGGSPVGDVSADYGVGITAPSAPIKPGFTFAGWYREPGCVTAWDFGSDTVPGNITLYAKWTLNSYTLRYYTQTGGSLKGTLTQTVSFGGNGTEVTAVPSTGYHFVRWSDGVSLASRTDRNIKANLDVTAQFTRNLYTLKYTAGKHGSLTGNGSQRVSYGASGTKVTAVPAAHYHFVRWSDGVKTASRTDASVSRNIDVTALFAINTYQVVFKDYNGRVLKKQTVAYGGNAAPPAAPKRAGYVFTGWNKGYTNVKARMTVTATYSKAHNKYIGIRLSF